MRFSIIPMAAVAQDPIVPSYANINLFCITDSQCTRNAIVQGISLTETKGFSTNKSLALEKTTMLAHATIFTSNDVGTATVFKRRMRMTS